MGAVLRVMACRGDGYFPLCVASEGELVDARLGCKAGKQHREGQDLSSAGTAFVQEVRVISVKLLGLLQRELPGFPNAWEWERQGTRTCWRVIRWRVQHRACLVLLKLRDKGSNSNLTLKWDSQELLGLDLSSDAA